MQKSMTRRTFAKVAAIAGAAAAFASAPLSALAEIPLDKTDLVETEMGDQGDGVKLVRTCCRACGKNECGVIVTVKDGRAVKVEGDAERA